MEEERVKKQLFFISWERAVSPVRPLVESPPRPNKVCLTLRKLSPQLINQSRSVTLLLWYTTASFLSRYSERAAFQLQLTKPNTTSLCSGLLGSAASSQRPHPAAVPVRSLPAARQPKTCIRTHCRSGPLAGAWNPLFVRSTFAIFQIHHPHPSRTGSEPLCGVLEVASSLQSYLGGGLPGCQLSSGRARRHKLNFHMDMWGFTCFLWLEATDVLIHFFSSSLWGWATRLLTQTDPFNKTYNSLPVASCAHPSDMSNQSVPAFLSVHL